MRSEKDQRHVRRPDLQFRDPQEAKEAKIKQDVHPVSTGSLVLKRGLFHLSYLMEECAY